jgi:hypothetical protein
MEIRTRNLIIWASVFTAAFLFSLILYLAASGRTEKYVLFFPSEITKEWIGESREIYYTRDTEDSVLALLNELALGPIGLRLAPTVPKGTGIRSVLLREKSVYIDFAATLVLKQPVLQISFSEMLSGIRKSVLYNFPSIEKVFIYVDGSPADAYSEA